MNTNTEFDYQIARRRGWILVGSSLLLALLVALSLGLGAVPLSGSEWVQALLRQGDPTHQVIVWDLRLPRALLATLVGAALGMAGALLQGMLGNGLADPFLLGISAGAGLAAVGVLTWGEWSAWVPLAAWIGGLATTVLVYGLARTAAGIATERLILAGVAVSALFGAISSALLLMADERVQVALNWLIGSINGRSWPEVQITAPYVLLGVLPAMGLARILNVLGLGDELAAGLGVSLSRTRLGIGLVAALLAAAAVSVSGLIGFVGLVVPHIVRRLVGSVDRWVVPLSAIGGAVLLTGSDLVARLGPIELPVGVVTALLGAPFFAGLLRRQGDVTD